jgi:hypothetical protein
MPVKVSSGQLRVLQVCACSTFDIWRRETEAASHAKRIPAMAQNNAADSQREVFYDIVAVYPIDAFWGHWPGPG